MPFDTETAAACLHQEAGRPLPAPGGGWPGGALPRELTRSPAAARVGALAARSGLFLFHFEHRAHLTLPQAWVPEDQPQLANPPAWAAGVLPERKYQSFRHDLALGSLHPGHRAKWTAHELCHGLVGFAWRPGASPLFHALAGRLAELLPVALWYFLDEAWLRRCPRHLGSGALFRDCCDRCEQVASPWPDDPDGPRRVEDGLRFIDRELAAVARSRRLGRPVPSRWATLDLSSDGVAYAGAHGARLDSEAFLHYASRFLVEGGGWSPSLDALEARVEEVARGVVGQEEPAPLAPTPVHGRWRWILQDVGWRLLTVWQDCDGQAALAIEALVDRLARVVDVTRVELGEPDGGAAGVEHLALAALQEAVARYEWLAARLVLPPADEVFAVGYPLAGRGAWVPGLADGVRSALPLSAAGLGPMLELQLEHFSRNDPPERAPIGVRFAAWLAHGPGALADLARYEAAIAHPPATDGGEAYALGPNGRDGRVRLAPGAVVLRFDTDVGALAEAMSAEGADPHEVLSRDWSRSVALVLRREPDGEVGVYEVPQRVAAALDALGDGAEPELAADEVAALRHAGLVIPAAWRE